MTFRDDLNQDQIGSLPLRTPIIVDPYTVVRAAVAVMRNQSLGCAVIVENGRQPTGIFTERSVIDLLFKNACLDDRPIGEFADPNFVVATESDPISKVWQAVGEGGARYVCVTDNEGKLIGVTGQRGLAEYLTESFASEVTTQRLGSTPWMQQREGA